LVLRNIQIQQEVAVLCHVLCKKELNGV